MHAYSVNTDERRTVPFWLAGVSISLMFGIHLLTTRYKVDFPWWLETPSAFGLYGSLYCFFDQKLWKVGFIRTLFGIKTPCLAGTWEGELTTSHDGHGTKLSATFTVSQKWTTMKVRLKRNTSGSESQTAMFVIDDDGQVNLSYQYFNDPTADAPNTMHAHDGTAMLEYRKDGEMEILEGAYYAGRSRQNIGTMRFRKI